MIVMLKMYYDDKIDIPITVFMYVRRNDNSIIFLTKKKKTLPRGFSRLVAAALSMWLSVLTQAPSNVG